MHICICLFVINSYRSLLEIDSLNTSVNSLYKNFNVNIIINNMRSQSVCNLRLHQDCVFISGLMMVPFNRNMSPNS